MNKLNGWQVVGLVVILVPQTVLAEAEPPPPIRSVQMAEKTSAAPDIGQQGSPELDFRTREWEASTEMVFVTSRGPMAGVPELSFTDLGLWRTNLAIAPLENLRLSVSATFVPKQPATLDESFWQSAGLGMRLGLSAGSAVGAEAGVGRLLADAGYYGTAGLGVTLRTIMSRFILWEGWVGASATHLWFDPAPSPRFWFAELSAKAEMQLCWDHCEHRDGATWINIDLGVPVFDRASDPAAALDPRTHLGFTLGSYLKVTTNWNVYGTVSWIDRGDPAVPATQLPILDGGFDQIQIAFGVIAHWPLLAPPIQPRGDYRDNYNDY